MAKIGDRIYFRCWDGKIETKIITTIEDRHGVVYDDGKTRIEDDYQMYSTGPNEAIESYNCLPSDDPDVVEFIQWHGGEQAMSVKEEIAAWLFSKGYISEPDDILVKSFFINLYNIDEDDL